MITKSTQFQPATSTQNKKKNTKPTVDHGRIWHLLYNTFQMVKVFTPEYSGLEWEKGVIVGNPVCQRGIWGLNVKLLFVQDMTGDHPVIRIEDPSKIRPEL